MHHDSLLAGSTRTPRSGSSTDPAPRRQSCPTSLKRCRHVRYPVASLWPADGGSLPDLRSNVHWAHAGPRVRPSQSQSHSQGCRRWMAWRFLDPAVEYGVHGTYIHRRSLSLSLGFRITSYRRLFSTYLFGCFVISFVIVLGMGQVCSCNF